MSTLVTVSFLPDRHRRIFHTHLTRPPLPACLPCPPSLPAYLPVSLAAAGLVSSRVRRPQGTWHGGRWRRATRFLPLPAVLHAGAWAAAAKDNAVRCASSHIASWMECTCGHPPRLFPFALPFLGPCNSGQPRSFLQLLLTPALLCMLLCCCPADGSEVCPFPQAATPQPGCFEGGGAQVRPWQGGAGLGTGWGCGRGRGRGWGRSRAVAVPLAL